MRATLRLSSPAWLAQPRITSSMAAGIERRDDAPASGAAAMRPGRRRAPRTSRRDTGRTACARRRRDRRGAHRTCHADHVRAAGGWPAGSVRWPPPSAAAGLAGSLSMCVPRRLGVVRHADVDRGGDAAVARCAPAPRSSTGPVRVPARRRRSPALRTSATMRRSAVQVGHRVRGELDRLALRQPAIQLRLAQPGQQHAAHRRAERRQARADAQRHAHDPPPGHAQHVDDRLAVEHRHRTALVDLAARDLRSAAAPGR